MRSLRASAAALVSTFVLTTTLGALAENSARTEAERTSASNEIVIWYRASQACPSGAEFVSTVRVEGRHARLAEAGDHIDYVVTLDSDGKKSHGRLERQTTRGTIAISELRGGDCKEVADAIALSLALAVTPPDSEPEPPPASAPPAEATANATTPTRSEKSAEPGATQETSVARMPPSAASRSDGGVPPLRAFWLGGGLHGALGMTPSAAVGGAVFLEYAWAGFSGPRSATFRAGPSVRYSSTHVEDFGHVDQWLATLGMQLCPLRWSAAPFALAPCVVGEGGLFVGRSERETAVTSANFWMALGPAVRGSARLGSRLSAGLTYAMMVPFSRQEVRAASEVLYRTPPAMFSLGADVLWALE